MRVVLQSIVLTGLGATADTEKLEKNAASGENIQMSIGSTLRFPSENRIDCYVTMESSSTSEAIRLRCTYKGSFSFSTDKELSDDDQGRISAMCTAKMFPYLRELVADVTRRLPLASPIILHPSLGDEEALLGQVKVQAQEPVDGTKKQ